MRVTIPIAELDHPVAILPPKQTWGNVDEYARCGGVMAMIAPHATGHEWAKDGTLLRVDCEHGISWVATHYNLNLRVIQQVRGSDEEVHRVAAWWAQG